jgi:hypothetical protein
MRLLNTAHVLDSGSKIRVRFRMSTRSAIQLVVLLVLAASGNGLCAQTIRIKLLNGKTGRAIGATCVNTWVGTERKQAMAIPTDKDGVASLRLTEKDAEINTQDPWKACGNNGVLNPTLKYASSIQINAGHVLCQVRHQNYTWLAIQRFSTKDVVQSGVVTANTCGNAKASPIPGEITLFVRPLTLWEKLKE